MRTLVALSFGCIALVALAGAPRGTPNRSSNESPKHPLSGKQDIERTGDGGTCSASVRLTGSGCHFMMASRPARGDGLVQQDVIACGKTRPLCGVPYTCDCNECDGSPDYAGRWHRDRRVLTDEKEADLVVHYDGGVCKADFAARGACEVRMEEKSWIGGCQHADSARKRLGCGADWDVCGQPLVCSCSDAGFRVIVVGAE